MKQPSGPDISKSTENKSDASKGDVFVFPTSFAQQQLWLLDQLGTGSAYNITMAVRLTGQINISAGNAIRWYVKKRKNL